MRIVVIIGPSGSGKTTLAKSLEASGKFQIWPTLTTRPKRLGEKDGHVFLSDQEYESKRGSFLGEVSLPGLPHRYALSRENRPHSERVILIARASMLAEITARLGPVEVYALEVSPQAAAARLRERGDSVPETAARLKEHQVELEAGRRVAHRVFNAEQPPKKLLKDVLYSMRADRVLKTKLPFWWLALPKVVRILLTIAITILLITGASMAAFFLLAVAAFSSWGSNK